MTGLEDNTIGGFNAMIQKRKRGPGEAFAQTALFDNVSQVLHDPVDVQQ